MKRILILLLAGILAFSAVGCGGGEAGKPLDIAQAASEIQKKVPFDDSLTPVDRETALTLYGLEAGDVEEISAYLGSGATAEEFVLIKAASGKTARCKEALEQRVEKQKEDFRDYVPAEAPKLEQACLMESGNTVILCVAKEGDTAKRVIKEILGA